MTGVFFTNKGIICGLALGGEHCFQEVGISYWTEKDGEKLVHHLRQVYKSPGGKERLWEQVPMVYFADEYKVKIRECRIEDVIEIDTFNELKAIDPIYKI